MAKIAMKQESARQSAAHLESHAAETHAAAARIVSAPAPAMPPKVAARVTEAVTRVAPALTQHAEALGSHATDLKKRAETIAGPATSKQTTPPAVKAVAQAKPVVQTQSPRPVQAPKAQPRLEPAKPKPEKKGGEHESKGKNAAEGTLTVLDAFSSTADLRKNAKKTGGARNAAHAGSAFLAHAATVTPKAAVHGKGSPKSLKAQLAWEAKQSKKMDLDLARKAVGFKGLKGAGATEAKALGKLGKLSKVAGPALGVVDIAASALTLKDGSKYKGNRGKIDRVVAGIAIPIESAELGVAMTVIAVPVGGEIVLGVLAVGISAYAIGNLLYDNRKAIARGLTAGAKFIEKHPEIIGGPAAAAAKALYDNRKKIESAVATTAKKTEKEVGKLAHEAKKAATTVAHEAKHVAKEAEHIGSETVGAIAHGAEWLEQHGVKAAEDIYKGIKKLPGEIADAAKGAAHEIGHVLGGVRHLASVQAPVTAGATKVERVVPKVLAPIGAAVARGDRAAVAAAHEAGTLAHIAHSDMHVAVKGAKQALSAANPLNW